MEPIPAAQLIRREGVLEHGAAVVAAQRVLRADLAQHLVVLHHPRPHLFAPGRRPRGRRQRIGEHGLTDPQLPDLPHHREVLALLPQPLQVRHAGDVHLGGGGRGPQAREGLFETGPELRHRRHRRSRGPAGVVRAHHHRDQVGLVRGGPRQLSRQVRHPRAGHRVVPAPGGSLGVPEQPGGEGADRGVVPGGPGDLRAVGQDRTGVETTRDGVAHGRDRGGCRVPARRALRPALSALLARPARAAPGGRPGQQDDRRARAREGPARAAVRSGGAHGKGPSLSSPHRSGGPAE